MRCLNYPVRFASTTINMIKLAWQTQPISFLGIWLFTVLEGLLPLGQAWVIKSLFDLLGRNLGEGLSVDASRSLTILLVSQGALLMLGDVVRAKKKYLKGQLKRQLTLKVYTQIYEKINSFAGIAYFEDPKFHNSIELATQGAQQGPAQNLDVLTNLFKSTITLVGFLGVLFSFNLLLAGLVGAAALPQLYSQLRIGRQRFDLASQTNPRMRRAFYYGTILSGVHAIKEMKVFDLGDHFLRKLLQTYRKIHQDQRSQELHELRWELFLGALSSLVSSGAFVAVIVQAFSGNLSLGDIVLYMNAVGSVQSALASIVFSLSSLNQSVLFYTHFTNLLALPQPLAVTSTFRSVTNLNSSIELRNVSFRYTREHPWILQNVNLLLPAHNCVALVGLNGAGKTTLVKLLTRLYDPVEGQILWNGIDIREFDPKELRSRISVIFQDFLRYDLTVKENIGLGNVKHMEDDTRIQQASIDAGIHYTIEENLPQRYNTLLGRWLADSSLGVDLSGGEWQKIALARMFMRNADLLILDEPTAALDAQSEHEIHRKFSQLVAGRTSLLISHRYNTVSMADIIAVLVDGTIKEYGSHDELLSLGGAYARHYWMQAEKYL